jgi:hypothetical protein
LHIPAKRFNPGSRYQSRLGSDPDFSHFRLEHLQWRQKMLRISGKDGPYGKRPTKRGARLCPDGYRPAGNSLRPESERWVIGSRHIQTIVNRRLETLD